MPSTRETISHRCSTINAIVSSCDIFSYIPYPIDMFMNILAIANTYGGY